MFKLNESTDFEDGNLSLITRGSQGLEKKAACDAISSFLSRLSTKPGKSYIHVNMLGSSETYGPTRNGDFFSEDTLRKYHKTFETNPAKLFKHHMNKSHSPSFGTVIFATFNENMKRIELVVEVDEVYAQELDALIAAGKAPKTSMACRLPHDRCSICGNVASTREKYCTHLKYEMGKIYPDGRRVSAINEDNVSWFDCSIVTVPADPTSSVLTKVAHQTVLGAAEMAEIMGIGDSFTKTSSIQKWSELIKEVTGGEVLQVDKHADKILASTLDLPTSLIEGLSNFSLSEVLTGMSRYGISPSIQFLAELIARKHLGPGYEGIGEIVEEYVHTIPGSTEVPTIKFEEPEQVSPLLHSIFSAYAERSSFLPNFVEKRASNIGYSGLGPYPEPTIREERLRISPEEHKGVDTFLKNYGKLLLGLGAASLLAKYYISSQIERKLKEHSYQNQAKIIIIKQASDLSITRSLCKRDMLKFAEQVGQKTEDYSNGLHHGARLTKSLLKVTGATKTTIGGKISTILRSVGLGFKVRNDLTKGDI